MSSHSGNIVKSPFNMKHWKLSTGAQIGHSGSDKGTQFRWEHSDLGRMGALMYLQGEKRVNQLIQKFDKSAQTVIEIFVVHFDVLIKETYILSL